ncbi:MAG: hypothetical protein ACXWQR_01275, partial [Ktedonobacterales bacterium]
ITGYYFSVDISTNLYALYIIGADGQPANVPNASGTIPDKLPARFALGVYYQGNTIKLYINNQLLANVSDSTFTSGWVGICANKGPVGFSDVQVYEPSQS